MGAARQKVGHLPQTLQRIGGEFRRFVTGVALRQIDQDRGDWIVLARQIHAGDHVGLVFAPGQRRGFAVGAAVVQGVNRSSGGIGVGIGIGVQSDEQIGLFGAGDGYALAQGNEGVVFAGKEN